MRIVAMPGRLVFQSCVSAFQNGILPKLHGFNGHNWTLEISTWNAASSALLIRTHIPFKKQALLKI